MDWDALLNTPITTLFGEVITYSPVGSDDYSVIGVVQLGVQLEALAPGTYASVLFKVADLEARPRPNDSVIVRGEAYRVVDAHADGSDTVRVSLQRIEPYSA